MMIILALFVVPGLGLVGVEGFRNLFDDSANVAKVGSYKITYQAFDQAMRAQMDQARQSLGENFDARAFDTPQTRAAVLDSMIDQRVLNDATLSRNLTVSDAAVRKAIEGIPAIAALRRPDGAFDTDSYRRLLAAQGMTPEQFDARVRYDLAGQQLPQNVQSSAMGPNSVASRLLAATATVREIRVQSFAPEAYLARVHPSDAQLHSWYEAHREALRTPEQAQIQYVTLNAATAGQGIEPTEAQLRKYYDDHIAQFRTEEEVRASHILIAAAKDASAADKAAAKAKAEALLKQVKAKPASFAELARSASQDPGSAAKGGDLGYFGHGMMLKSFEDAAFALKKGEISGLVQSDFGYHIIEVTDRKPAETRPFEAVKAELVAPTREDLAKRRLADDVAGFENAVYEHADSLEPAAAQYKLPVRTATVSRTPGSAADADPVLKNPKLLAAVFADDALKAHHNTAAIDLGDGSRVAARVLAYQPSTVPAFEAVRSTVLARVTAEQASRLAREDGEKRLAALRKSPDDSGFGPVQKVSLNEPQGLTPDAMRALVTLDRAKLPAFAGAVLPDGGYAVIRLQSVTPPDSAGPDQLRAAARQVDSVLGQAEFDAYLKSLRAEASVKKYSTQARKVEDEE